MKRFLRLDWRAFGVEMLVVFIGLFAALQVDDWRDERAFRQAETRYLERLREDLADFRENAGDLLQFLERNRDAVQYVSDSLSAGRLIDGQTRKFEIGLIYVAHLPSLQIPASAYDEMVASGMFARLRSDQLKQDVSELYATQALVEKNFSWWRDSPQDLEDLLMSRVRMYSEDRMEPQSRFVLSEPVRRVEFDFEALHSDRELANRFYWAADTHNDWVTWTRELVALADQAVKVLDEELGGK